jgi:3-dehydroquinate synthase
VRAHLNFGHTFGHAIEASVGYGAILHGEAVGLGMLAATTLAASAGLCDPGLRPELESLVAAAGLPVRARLPDDERLLAAMALDKKVARARIRFVLPTRLGAVELRDDLEPDRIRAAWASIRT